MSSPAERPSQRMPVATPVAFEVGSGNGYVVLTLEDGAVLHVHPIVMDVSRTSVQDERGEPVYSVQAGLAVRLLHPPTKRGEGT